jgi:AAA15 family ATPase/GTPase
MLIEFNFTNYKSFLIESTLNFEATSGSEQANNIINASSKINLLPVISLHGKNGGGKSNVILAFNYMRFMINKSFSTSNKEELKTVPFKFSKESKSSSFEVHIFVNNKYFQYGFDILENTILDEWLIFHATNGREVTILNRGESIFHHSIGKKKDILLNLENHTLYLSALQNIKAEYADDVLDWFRASNVLNFGTITSEYYLDRYFPANDFLNDARLKSRFLEFLKSVDINVIDIKIEKKDDGEGFKLFTIHQFMEGEGTAQISLNDESSGTRKMIALFSHIDRALRTGSILFIDELDSKLHPKLLRYIITMFQESTINVKHAQLVFTTHDIMSLRHYKLRRDQYWFADKHENGCSEIYSLAEFKIRNDRSFDKDYYLGKYKAIPNLSYDELIEEGAYAKKE